MGSWWVPLGVLFSIVRQFIHPNLTLFIFYLWPVHRLRFGFKIAGPNGNGSTRVNWSSRLNSITLPWVSCPLDPWSWVTGYGFFQMVQLPSDHRPRRFRPTNFSSHLILRPVEIISTVEVRALVVLIVIFLWLIFHIRRKCKYVRKYLTQSLVGFLTEPFYLWNNIIGKVFNFLRSLKYRNGNKNLC